MRGRNWLLALPHENSGGTGSCKLGTGKPSAGRVRLCEISRPSVPLDTFECQDVTDCSFIQRVRFDQAQDYMLISLKGTYYNYCEIGSEVVQALLASPSRGKFYDANIKGTRSDAPLTAVPITCRTIEASMFWRRNKAVPPIGSLAKAGQSIAVDCRACGVTSHIDTSDTPFPDKMELHIAQRLLPCPNCVELNGDGLVAAVLLPDVH